MKKYLNILFGSELNKNFNQNKSKIQNENAKTLNVLFCVSFFIILVVYLIDLIFNLFVVSGNYLLFFIFVFLIEIILLLFKVKKPGWLIRLDVLIFMVVGYCFAILLDNYLTLSNSRSLFLIFMLLFNVVFIEKPHITISTTFVFLTIFVLSSYYVKDATNFAMDAVYGIIVFIISIMLNVIIISTRLKEIDNNRRLDIKSNIDELSGLFNRRSFNNYSKKHEIDFVSKKGDMSVIMFDIDCFKNYNDTYNHLKGDDCIVAVAKVLLEIENKYGIYAARYGGEEFVAILKDKNLKQAKLIAKEVLENVEALQIKHATSPLGYVTVSAGCASKLDNEIYNSKDLVNQADQNLYKAKIKGKNCVV